MDTLDDVQLLFESYAKQAKAGLGLFESEDLSIALSTLESYLNKIVSEYEEQLPLFDGAPPSRALKDLSRLREFIGPYSEANEFRSDFKKPFLTIQKEIVDALIRHDPAA